MFFIFTPSYPVPLKSGKYFVDPAECGDSGESSGPGDYGKTDDFGKTGKSDELAKLAILVNLVN